VPLLIDGHNLIGQMPDLQLTDPDDEMKLISRLRAYCARSRKRATVVFDSGLPGGRSPQLSRGELEVVFASAGRTADGILKERIQHSRDPRGLIVISSDRDVARAARRRGARVEPSGAFAARLSARPESRQPLKPGGLSPDEIDEWLKIFKRDEK